MRAIGSDTGIRTRVFALRGLRSSHVSNSKYNSYIFSCIDD